MITKEGFDYQFNPDACASCEGKCCTGASGNIFATKNEYEKIAKHLNISMQELIDTYLRKVDKRFSIKERVVGLSYDCIFYDREKNGCGIYEVRPTQCRTFPFWDYFKTHKSELQNECPGVVFSKS